MTAIVFRSLRSPAEREAGCRLLADSGVVPPAAGAGGAVLFGLWDLAAPDGEALFGVAATRRREDAGSVELYGIAVRPGLRRRGLGHRLVAEVADALRAQGAACLVARLGRDHGPAAVLLASAGFAPGAGAPGRPAGMDDGWHHLWL